MDHLLSNAFLVRAVFSGFTLYMLAILLRWFGPWIQLDLESKRLRWIARITDPLIRRVRHALPETGPIALGPLFALLLVWLVRQVSVWSLILIMRRQS